MPLDTHPTTSASTVPHGGGTTWAAPTQQKATDPSNGVKPLLCPPSPPPPWEFLITGSLVQPTKPLLLLPRPPSSSYTLSLLFNSLPHLRVFCLFPNLLTIALPFQMLKASQASPVVKAEGISASLCPHCLSSGRAVPCAGPLAGEGADVYQQHPHRQPVASP